jgi:hypothetical protein
MHRLGLCVGGARERAFVLVAGLDRVRGPT